MFTLVYIKEYKEIEL